MSTRRIEVEIIGNAANVEKAFGRASASAGQFGRDVEKSGKGAVAASLSFQGLGRAAIFASSSFLGGAGLVFGLKSVVDAAKNAQEANEQLAVAMKDQGLSFDSNKTKIDAYVKKQSELSAFQQTDLLASFTSLVRTTGDVGKAMDQTSLASDLARARNISLASSTSLLVQIEGGRFRGLAQLGIAIPKVTTAQDELKASGEKFTSQQVLAAKSIDLNSAKLIAMDEVQKKVAGSAETYGNSAAGASDKFKVAVQNLEIELGTALLPTLTQGLSALSGWINHLNDSGDAAKYAKDAVGLVKDGVHDVTPVVKLAADAFKQLSDALGGDKQAAEALIGAFATYKVATAISNLGAAAGASGAAKDVGLLTSRLTTLGKIGAIGVTLYIATQFLPKPGGSLTPLERDLMKIPILGGVVGTGIAIGQAISPPSIAGVQSPTPSAAADARLHAKVAADFARQAGDWGSPTSIVGGTAASAKRTFSYSSLKSLWEAAGGDPSQSDTMAAIALAESSGRSWAVGGPNTNGTFDYGCWQINSSHGYDPAKLTAGDQSYNARCAVSIYNSQGLHAWSTYNNGAYLHYLQHDSSSAAPSSGASATTAAAIIAQGTPKTSPAITGSKLLSPATRTALANAKGTPGKADDLTALKQARTELEALQKTASKAEKVPIAEELGKINAAINTIDNATYKKKLAEQTAATKKELAAQKALWMQHVHDLQSVASLDKTTFERAFGDLSNAIDKQFDRNTQRGMDALKAELDSKTGAIEKARAALTPEEQAVADLQAAHDAAVAAKSLADDTAAVTVAQGNYDQAVAAGASESDLATLRANILAAQKTLADEQYNQTLADMQKKADASRIAANQNAQDQQDAATISYNAQVQNYQDERDLQKVSLDTQLQDLKTHLETRGTTVDSANQQILALMKSFGLDPTWSAAGANAGSALVAGLAAALSQTGDSLGAYRQAADAASNAQTAGPGAAVDSQAIGDAVAALAPGSSLVVGKQLLTKVAPGHVVRVPLMAEGGIAMRPTVAVIGEAGPEAVIPLRRLSQTGAPKEVHVHLHGGTFIGSSMKKAAEDLAPHLKRVISL